MKIKNAIKRSLAAIVSLMIVISAVSGALSTFAAVADTDYTIDTSGDMTGFTKDATAISSVAITHTLDGGTTYKTVSPSAENVEKIKDADVATQLEIYNNTVFENDVYKGYFHDWITTDADGNDVFKNPSSIVAKYISTDGSSGRKVRITLTLKGKTNVSNIVLVHAGGSGTEAGSMSTANYAVFASDTSADLYDKNNADFYHLYDNKTNKKKYQNYTFSEGALTGVKYVGIEIYDPHIDWADSYVTSYGANIFYPRINEFNVYGTVLPDNITYDDNALLTETEKGDLTVVASDISVATYRNGVQYASGLDVKNIIDESLDTKVEFMQSGTATNNYAFYQKDGTKFTDGEGDPIDVTVDFTIDVTPGYAVKKLTFVNSSPADSTGRPNFTTKYEIYAGNDKATLFDPANRIEEIDNSNSFKRQIIDIKAEFGLDVKYIGYRVIEPVDLENFGHKKALTSNDDNYIVPRIAQLGVYGSELSRLANATATNLDAVTVPNDLGTKLTGTETVGTVKYYANGSGTPVPEGSAASGNLVSIIYDGDGSTNYQSHGAGVVITESGQKVVKTYDDGYYYEIEYDLGSYDTINNVFVAHHPDSSSNGLRVQSYEVFASNDKATLWKDSSKVAVVDTSNSIAQKIAFKEAVSARYVGLRTIKTVRDDYKLGAGTGYLRIAEFNVYGTKGTTTLVNLASDSATIAVPEGTSVVKSMEAQYKSPTATNPSAISPNYDTSSAPDYSVLEGLTTANTVSGVRVGETFAANTTIYRDGTTAYSDIIYTLDGKCEISDIFVAEHIHNRWKLAYKLYVGDDKDTIFDGTPIYTYTDTSATLFQHYEVAGISAKYVALRITAATVNDNWSEYSGYGAAALYPRLFGFGVLGTVDMTARAPEEGASLPLPTGTSAVKDTSVYYFNGENRNPSGLINPEELYDNDIVEANGEAAGSEISTPFAYYDETLKKSVHYTDRYLDIVLNLKGQTALSDVFVASRSNPELMTVEYSLYIGNDKDTLFDGDPYYYCDNSDKQRIQHYKFDGTLASYVGIRITKAIGTTGLGANWKYCYVRLNEFNAYGTVQGPSGDSGSGSTGDAIPEGNNFLLNKVPSIIHYKKDGNTSTPGTWSSNIYANITDGKIDTQYHTGSSGVDFAYWDEQNNAPAVYTNGEVYTDIQFDLGGTAKVEKLFFRGASGAETRTGKFEVYASDNLGDLYTKKVASVDNTVTKEYYNHITFDTPLEGIRYIAVRILNPINSTQFNVGTMQITKEKLEDGSHNVYPRINEIAAIGSLERDRWTYQKVTNLTSLEFPYGMDFTGLKFLNHYETSIRAKSSGYDVLKAQELAASPGNTTNIADGDFVTQAMLSLKFAAVEGDSVTDYTQGRVRYQDVWYDLKSEADLTHIVLAFPSNDALIAGDYEVYIGDTLEELYTGTPYASIDNYTQYTTKGYNNRMNVISFDKSDNVADTARYVGIRIYNPVSQPLGSGSTLVNQNQNHIYGRIQEFQIHGNYIDPTFDPAAGKVEIIAASDFDLSTLPEVFGPNLLLAKNFSYSVESGTLSNQVQSDIKEVVSRTGDELEGMHKDISNVIKGNNAYLIFKLTEWDLTQIDGFAFRGLASGNEGYFASDYEIIVAEEKEDIFTTAPAFHYNLEDFNLTDGQIVEFPEGKEPQGCYFAIKFNDPCYTAVDHRYLRLSVLYAWGQEAVIAAVPANIAENMPCDISFVNGDKRTAVTESNLTAKELMRITDADLKVDAEGNKVYTSKLDTYGTINTKGNNRDTLEMVYNLCGEVDVSKISVTTLINNTTGFGKMKVYASNVLQGVYDEDSLIWTYKVGNKTGKISPTKTFKKTKQMRYVRFVFEDTKNSVRLYTIDVIGMDNQKMKTRNITNSLDSSHVSVKRKNPETGIETFYSVYGTLLGALIDNDKNSYLAFENENVGDATYKVLIDLDDLRTVSNLEISYNYGFEEFWPKKLNVYLAETSLEVENLTKPDYVVKPKDFGKDATLSLQIRPRLARYVVLEVVEFYKNEFFKLADGSYKMATAISEVKITGTKVKGMQKDSNNETLVTFKDKKTGANVSLIKLDENDIFTGAVSVRLTPEKATNWQMRSLEPSLTKVHKKTIYKVELLDLYGKVVTDFGGRLVQVSFPTPKGYENGKALIGNASNRTQILALDTAEYDGMIHSSLMFNANSDNKVAVLLMTVAEDPYWSTIGELENFEEGNLDDLYGRDELWYESIHTTDDRFVATPINASFDSGMRFTATDISDTMPEATYRAVLETATSGKQVAVFYDIELSMNNEAVAILEGTYVDVALTMPEYLKNGYADLEVYYIGDNGVVEYLWSGLASDDVLQFQLSQTGKVAIVGTVLEGAGIAGTNPDTGESTTAATTVIMIMTAAAFVIMLSIRRGLRSK